MVGNSVVFMRLPHNPILPRSLSTGGDYPVAFLYPEETVQALFTMFYFSLELFKSFLQVFISPHMDFKWAREEEVVA